MTKPFLALIDEATKTANKNNDHSHLSCEQSFMEGAQFANELLVMALQALYSYADWENHGPLGNATARDALNSIRTKLEGASK